MDRSQRLTDGTGWRTFMRLLRLDDLITAYTNARPGANLLVVDLDLGTPSRLLPAIGAQPGIFTRFDATRLNPVYRICCIQSAPARHLQIAMPVDVLLIEDNLGDAVLIRDAVNRLPVAVNLHVAMDGHQALLLLSNPHFQPDLIVLDLNIPKISGMGLLELWKGYRTAVVVLSSSSNPKEREFCLAAGACEFVTKPVELEEFQKAVARIIEHWGSRVVSARRSVARVRWELTVAVPDDGDVEADG